jgi:hypothetical protein
MEGYAKLIVLIWLGHFMIPMFQFNIVISPELPLHVSFPQGAFSHRIQGTNAEM